MKFNDIMVARLDIRMFLIEMQEKGEPTTKTIHRIMPDRVFGGYRMPAVSLSGLKGRKHEGRLLIMNNQGKREVIYNWTTRTSQKVDTLPKIEALLKTGPYAITVNIKVTDSPPDFDRIEVFVLKRQKDKLSEPIVFRTSVIVWDWRGWKGQKAYFFAKAYNKEGNSTPLISLGSTSISRKVKKSQIDKIPPGSTRGKGIMEKK